MRKLFSLILVSAIALTLLSCGTADTGEASVRFYYLHQPEYFEYGAPDGMVTYEIRSPGGYEGNVNYLLTLYLQGPLKETLDSPFPANCRLLDIALREGTLYVTLTSEFQALEGIRQSLACVCLARTCFSMTDVQTVHILAESAAGHITPIKIISTDDLLPTEPTAPQDSGA